MERIFRIRNHWHDEMGHRVSKLWLGSIVLTSQQAIQRNLPDDFAPGSPLELGILCWAYNYFPQCGLDADAYRIRSFQGWGAGLLWHQAWAPKVHLAGLHRVYVRRSPGGWVHVLRLASWSLSGQPDHLFWSFHSHAWTPRASNPGNQYGKHH